MLEKRIQNLFDAVDSRSGAFAGLRYIGVDDFLSEPFLKPLDFERSDLLSAIREWRLERILGRVRSELAQGQMQSIFTAAERWRHETGYDPVQGAIFAKPFKAAGAIAQLVHTQFRDLGLFDVETKDRKHSLDVMGDFEIAGVGKLNVAFNLKKIEFGLMKFDSFEIGGGKNPSLFELGFATVTARVLYASARIEFPDQYNRLRFDADDLSPVASMCEMIAATLGFLRNEFA